MGWGVLIPTGAIIARYLRTFKSADPAWFYLHVACQLSGYSVGVAGWATGLKLGKDSEGVQHTAHRNIGIALFCVATLQVGHLLPLFFGSPSPSPLVLVLVLILTGGELRRCYAPGVRPLCEAEQGAQAPHLLGSLPPPDGLRRHRPRHRQHLPRLLHLEAGQPVEDHLHRGDRRPGRHRRAPGARHLGHIPPPEAAEEGRLQHREAPQLTTPSDVLWVRRRAAMCLPVIISPTPSTNYYCLVSGGTTLPLFSPCFWRLYSTSHRRSCDFFPAVIGKIIF